MVNDVTRAHWRLRPMRTTPATSRTLVRETAIEADLPDRVREGAATVAGALVLNSIINAHSTLQLMTACDGESILIRIHDTCRQVAPTVARPHPLHGIDVVQNIATAYGYTRHDDGRTLWARLGPTPLESTDEYVRVWHTPATASA